MRARGLYMHSTLPLISFYKTFGFVPIPDDHAPDDQGTYGLPVCFGEMAGCNVCPMRREAGSGHMRSSVWIQACSVKNTANERREIIPMRSNIDPYIRNEIQWKNYIEKS